MTRRNFKWSFINKVACHPPQDLLYLFINHFYKLNKLYIGKVILNNCLMRLRSAAEYVCLLNRILVHQFVTFKHLTKIKAG